MHRLINRFLFKTFVGFAYVIVAIQKLFLLPMYVYVAGTTCALIAFTFYSLSLGANSTTLQEKYRLALSSPSTSVYERFLRYVQAQGDHATAERIYASLQPALVAKTPKVQRDMRAVVYPREHLLKQQYFWETVQKVQPQAREVFVALTALSYQQFDMEKTLLYRAEWEKIEPNDPRLLLISTQNIQNTAEKLEQ